MDPMLVTVLLFMSTIGFCVGILAMVVVYRRTMVMAECLLDLRRQIDTLAGVCESLNDHDRRFLNAIDGIRKTCDVQFKKCFIDLEL